MPYTGEMKNIKMEEELFCIIPLNVSKCQRMHYIVRIYYIIYIYNIHKKAYPFPIVNEALPWCLKVLKPSCKIILPLHPTMQNFEYIYPEPHNSVCKVENQQSG